MFKRKKYSWLHFDFIMTPLRVVRPPLFWHLPQRHPEVWSITWSLSLDSRNLNNPIQLHKAGQEKRILLLYVNDEITLLQSGRDLDTLSFFFGEKHVFFFLYPKGEEKKTNFSIAIKELLVLPFLSVDCVISSLWKQVTSSKKAIELSFFDTLQGTRTTIIESVSFWNEKRDEPLTKCSGD